MCAVICLRLCLGQLRQIKGAHVTHQAGRPHTATTHWGKFATSRAYNASPREAMPFIRPRIRQLTITV